jgi:hypothetical protein
MHPAIPHLIELQRVDHQIAVLRAELEAFPKRIRDAETKLGGARADVASAKEAHAQVVAERKKFEFDGQQWKDRARKYRDQSGAVKTNEAYKALQHEIANAEAEVAKADDRQLEVMMAAEDVERRVKIAESPRNEKKFKLRVPKKRNSSTPPPPNAKKSSLRCRKICASFTRASPSATTARQWPKPATGSAVAAACASCRIFFRNSVRKPTKKFSAARAAA